MELNKNFVRELLLFVESLDTPDASEEQLSEFCNNKGYTGIKSNRYKWFEEVICDVASHFFLEEMGGKWG